MFYYLLICVRIFVFWEFSLARYKQDSCLAVASVCPDLRHHQDLFPCSLWDGDVHGNEHNISTCTLPPLIHGHLRSIYRVSVYISSFTLIRPLLRNQIWLRSDIRTIFRKLGNMLAQDTASYGLRLNFSLLLLGRREQLGV